MRDLRVPLVLYVMVEVLSWQACWLLCLVGFPLVGSICQYWDCCLGDSRPILVPICLVLGVISG